MTSNDAPGSRVVVFHHRPLDDHYHGSSIMYAAFVSLLRSRLPVTVVAPPLAKPRTGAQGESTRIPLAAFRYLVQSQWEGIRFFLADARRPRKDPPRVLVALDLYLAWLLAIWTRVRREHLVYYVSDLNRSVGPAWGRSGAPGGPLYRWTHWLLEWFAISAADLVLVPSEAVRQDLSSSIPSDRIVVCRILKPLPAFRADAVAEWHRRLGLEGRIGVVFVGSFEYLPNVQAFRFLCDSLAPEISSRDPRIRIVVAGRGSEGLAGGVPPNVSVVGTVDDLSSLLFACSVGVAPMTIPGGTSMKIVDYVLHGLEVVATPEASRGVDPSPRIHGARLSEFVQRVCEVASRVDRPGATPTHSPPPDPFYVKAYTEGAGSSAAIDTIVRWASE